MEGCKHSPQCLYRVEAEVHNDNGKRERESVGESAGERRVSAVAYILTSSHPANHGFGHPPNHEFGHPPNHAYMLASSHPTNHEFGHHLTMDSATHLTMHIYRLQAMQIWDPIASASTNHELCHPLLNELNADLGV
jgi:hypothetical protein